VLTKVNRAICSRVRSTVSSSSRCAAIERPSAMMPRRSISSRSWRSQRRVTRRIQLRSIRHCAPLSSQSSQHCAHPIERSAGGSRSPRGHPTKVRRMAFSGSAVAQANRSTMTLRRSAVPSANEARSQVARAVSMPRWLNSALRVVSCRAARRCSQDSKHSPARGLTRKASGSISALP